MGILAFAAAAGALTAGDTDRPVYHSKCKACGWSSPPGTVIRGTRCRCGGQLETVPA